MQKEWKDMTDAEKAPFMIEEYKEQINQYERLIKQNERLIKLCEETLKKEENVK